MALSGKPVNVTDAWNLQISTGTGVCLDIATLIGTSDSSREVSWDYCSFHYLL